MELGAVEEEIGLSGQMTAPGLVEQVQPVR